MSFDMEFKVSYVVLFCRPILVSATVLPQDHSVQNPVEMEEEFSCR